MFIYFRLFPPSKEMKFCPFNSLHFSLRSSCSQLHWLNYWKNCYTLDIHTEHLQSIHYGKILLQFFKVKMSDFLKKTTVNEAWMSVVIWQLSHHSARFLMIIIVSIVSKLSLFGGTQKLMPSFAFNKLLLFYSIE